MSTGQKKQLLEEIDNLFADKTEETPALINMVNMLSQNKPTNTINRPPQVTKPISGNAKLGMEFPFNSATP